MLIGNSPQINKIKKYCNQLAKIEDSFLIIGESGTGKKAIVREIHNKSSHKNHQLVFLNCSTLGNTINDSDLYSKTDIKDENTGIFERVYKGTLCLENVDEIPSTYQKLFFNVLKEKKYVNPYSKRKHDVTFRICAITTNYTIKSQDNIRKDLLSLLDNHTIIVPPLKERKQDIPSLFTYFLEQTCEENNKEIPDIPENLYESIIDYNWPGNVTELKKSVENIVLMSKNDELDTSYLPFEVKKHPLEYMIGYNLPEAVDEVEKYLITKTMKRYAGNQTSAAKALNISEGTLRYKMKKYGLNRKSFKD